VSDARLCTARATRQARRRSGACAGAGTNDEAAVGVDWIELPPIGRRPTGFYSAGLTTTQRRWFDRGLAVVVLLFAGGWMYAIIHATATGTPRPGLTANLTANPLSADAPPPAAYLLDRTLREFTERAGYAGRSGAVRVVVHEPGQPPPFADSLPEDVEIAYIRADTDTSADAAAADTVAAGDPVPPGIWDVLLRARNGIRRVPDLTVLSMVPLAQKRGGRIGQYIIGSWPNEAGGTPRSEAYRPPAGLIRVTPDRLDMPVSRHFRLRDFVTKGQENVWPKYVLVSPRLLDKLELTIDELERSGTPVRRVGVISGFRTPSYNAGGGDTGGRGALSRHMYGDAMDWFVDNDGDGRMDDLNGDGRVDADDGRVIVAAAERVEARYPDLVGGIGLYRPTSAHAGFVHIDTRGYRARW
jgi:hypothetical protein